MRLPGIELVGCRYNEETDDMPGHHAVPRDWREDVFGAMLEAVGCSIYGYLEETIHVREKRFKDVAEMIIRMTNAELLFLYYPIGGYVLLTLAKDTSAEGFSNISKELSILVR